MSIEGSRKYATPSFVFDTVHSTIQLAQISVHEKSIRPISVQHIAETLAHADILRQDAWRFVRPSLCPDKLGILLSLCFCLLEAQ